MQIAWLNQLQGPYYLKASVCALTWWTLVVFAQWIFCVCTVDLLCLHSGLVFTWWICCVHTVDLLCLHSGLVM